MYHTTYISLREQYKLTNSSYFNVKDTQDSKDMYTDISKALGICSEQFSCRESDILRELSRNR